MNQTKANRAARLTLQDAREDNVPVTAADAETAWNQAVAVGRVEATKTGQAPVAWTRAWAWVCRCEEAAQ